MTESDLVTDLSAALQDSGVDDPAFVEVLAGIDIRDFAPIAHREAVAVGRWLPLECGQSMPSPDLVARVVHAVGATSGHSVLEIGTGSGLQTALLSKVARKVTTLERYRTLSHNAARRLENKGIDNVAFHVRDGSVVHRDGVLYDRIVIDSAFDQVPRQYIDMLAANGVLVCAVGPLDGTQQLLRLTKIGSRFDRQTLFPVRFNGLEKGTAHAL